MNRANRVKLAVSAFLIITTVAFFTGCSREQAKQAVRIQPQHCATTLPVTPDVVSQQNTTTSVARTPAQQGNLSVALNQTAGKAAASTDARLDSRIDLSGIKIGLPFGQTIEIIRNSTHPPLNIVVLWNDVRDNARIDRYTPIGAEPISGVSLRKNLEILLASLPEKLDYTVTDGVIVIATEVSLPKKMQRRTYDITDLSSRPADYYTQTNGAGVTTQGR